MTETNRAPSRLWGWLLLIGPLLPPVIFELCVWHHSFYRWCAQEQFLNCYFSMPLFVGFAVLMIGAFVLSTCLGASPVRAVAAQPLRFGAFAIILVPVGGFILQPDSVSGPPMVWGTRVTQSLLTGYNLLIGAQVAVIFQLFFPFDRQTRSWTPARIALAVAIGFWGYMSASLWRISAGGSV